jgi:hypothetical protein
MTVECHGAAVPMSDERAQNPVYPIYRIRQNDGLRQTAPGAMEFQQLAG